MIDNDLFSCFYVITLEGDYVKTIFANDDYHIKSIKCVSKKLDNDFIAYSYLDKIKEKILPNLDNAEYSVLYNDLFTPKDLNIVWTSLNKNKDNIFDDMGDSVFYKSSIKNDSINLQMKIIVDPAFVENKLKQILTCNRPKYLPENNARSFH